MNVDERLVSIIGATYSIRGDQIRSYQDFYQLYLSVINNFSREKDFSNLTICDESEFLTIFQGIDLSNIDIVYFRCVPEQKINNFLVYTKDGKSLEYNFRNNGNKYFKVSLGDSKYLSIMYDEDNRPFISADKYNDSVLKLNYVNIDDLPVICNNFQKGNFQELVDKGMLSLTDEARSFLGIEHENEKSEISTDEIVIQPENIEIVEQNIDKENGYSNKKIDKEVIDAINAIKAAGFELSKEQLDTLDFYNRFEEFKANKEVREEKQKEALELHAEESRKVEEWHNSPENPTNQRLEELNQIKEQLLAVKNLEQVMPQLVSQEQKEFIKKTEEHLAMRQLADSKEHQVDTGMDEEIRQWYINNYGSQEPGKSR